MSDIPVDVTGMVAIWAIPRSKWDRDMHPENPDPFYYELRTGTAWENGAVKVVEKEVFIPLPPGVDLLGKALETLRQKQQEIRASAEKQVNELQAQINDLMLLTHQPEEVVAEQTQDIRCRPDCSCERCPMTEQDGPLF